MEIHRKTKTLNRKAGEIPPAWKAILKSFVFETD